MKDFEDLCGLSSGYITSMRKSFGGKKLNNVLTAFPELNRDWLLYGEGEMLKIDPTINKVELGVNSFLVPCIPLRAEAGTLSGFSDSVMPYESYMVASPVKGADFAIDIHGDSMEPEYPNGCRVFVQKIQLDYIKEGYVYVFDTMGGIILKEVVKVNTDSLIYHSLNPKYSDDTLAFADIHSNGVYRVLGCLTFK